MAALHPHKHIGILSPTTLFAVCLVVSVAVCMALCPAEARSQTLRSAAAASQNAREKASDAPRNLPLKTRRAIFERIWNEIDEHYYDPAFNGVNWDDVHTRYLPRVVATKNNQEFYALMSELTGELHDAHTRFSSPEQWRNFKRQQRVSPGFSVDDVDGKTVVIHVRPESSAAKAGIEPGMVLLTIDGRSVEDRIAEIEKTRAASSSDRATRLFVFGRLLGGAANSTMKVSLRRGDGTTLEASVVRQTYSAIPEVGTDVLPSGAAYIHFDGFQPRIVGQFRRALVRFRNSPGLVIDLRRNGGGDLSALLPIAGYFFDKKTVFAKDSTRSGKPLTQFAGIFRLPLELSVGRPGDQIYAGPVAILVDARSASSSEVFAAGMQDTRRAKIIGSPTCGCVLGIAKPRELKGGSALEMSEVLWFSPNGRKLEGAGVIPDEEVIPTVEDLRQKRDPVIAQAEKVLHQLIAGDRRIARR
jgi:carboxyl-terminal processing protease